MKTLYKHFAILVLFSFVAVKAQNKIYTFQTCGATGPNGPTQTQVNNTYTSGNTLNNAVTINTQGIQEWIVPKSGFYKISMAGASGGFANSFGGRGQILTGEIFLTTGTVLQIVVGQSGSGNSGGSSGGGGGSFVVNASGSAPLFIAGGGAGVYYLITTTVTSGDADYANSGKNSYCGTGTGGTGGNGGNGSNNGWGCGGGGFSTDGNEAANSISWGYSGKGYAFVNGAQGGNTATSAYGGFGGGGGTHGNTGGGGGGGGYSGGGGCNQDINPNSGGGGGSFLANTVVNDSNLGFNIGNGFVIIREIFQPCALNFDGINDFIQIPTFNMSSGNSMTIEAWVKPTDITTNTNYEITRQQGSSLDWLLSFQNNGTIISFGLNTTNNYNELDVSITPSNYTDGNWHHIAAVYDGSNKYIYVDGVLIGSNSQTGNITYNATQNFIGSYNGSSEFFNGDIDEIRFWNITRTLSQLTSNKDCDINAQSNLVALYHFNDGQPLISNIGNDTLSDDGGNNNDGILYNFGLSAGTTSNWVKSYLPEINLKGNNITIVKNKNTVSTSDSTDFGIVNMGTKRSFTIENKGKRPIIVSGITTTGVNASDFVISGVNFPLTIVPDSSKKFIVTLNSLLHGNKVATINIVSNDCSNGLFKFNISGYVNISEPHPVIATPSTICLGDSSKLVASRINYNILWYNKPVGGVKIGNSMSDSGFFVKPTVKDTFYAESYIVISGTREYNIPLSSITGLNNNCGSGSMFSSGNNVVFSWTDNTSNTITAAEIKFAVGVECDPNTKTTSLNSVSQPTFSTNSWCSCSVDYSVNGLKTITLNPTNYTKGGNNQFQINNSGTFGLLIYPSLSNVYAKVIVSYLDTLRSPTRTPVVVNVGCGCKLSSTLPTTPGTYISTQSDTSGNYVCFCDDNFNLLLALDTNGTNAVVPNNGVSLQIGNTKIISWSNAGGIISNPNGGVIFNRKWDVTPTTQPSSPVKVKFFFTQSEYDSVRVKLATVGTTITSPTQFEMYKLFSNGFGDPHANGAAGIILLNGSNPSINEWSYSSIGSDHCAEFLVSSFSGGGGGGGSGAMPLPVKFNSFSATPINNTTALLKWQTSYEINNSHFELERSFDGIHFTTINTVLGRNNSQNIQIYEYIDNSIPVGTPIAYYRIKQVDLNGESSSSKIQMVKFNNNQPFVSIYPNPFNEILFINFNSIQEHENIQITILDALGKSVFNQNLYTQISEINLSDLSKGIYQIILKTETQTQTMKIIK